MQKYPNFNLDDELRNDFDVIATKIFLIKKVCNCINFLALVARKYFVPISLYLGPTFPKIIQIKSTKIVILINKNKKINFKFVYTQKVHVLLVT